MKAKQSKTPRALATGTRLACADNTGARTVQIISVFGYHGVRRIPKVYSIFGICLPGREYVEIDGSVMVLAPEKRINLHEKKRIT